MKLALKYGVALAALLLLISPVAALITRLTSLADLLNEATFVITAKVDTLDSKRPAMVLTVDEALKGKPAFKKIGILLEGDSRAKKLKEPPELLKRLGDKLPMVLFINKRDTNYAGFVFTNGTWFSITGTTVDGDVRWSLTHLEPYLRRTFKGTTAEMTQTMRDALSGKRKPPEPNAREKPGLGPEIPKKSSMLRVPLEPPQRGVIPTVFIGGPLALLAMLFPTVFGGWHRWLALLTTAGTTSTLFTLQWWFADELVGSWWGTPLALWVIMSLINVVGLAWSWQRHLSLVQIGEAPLLASWIERLLLALVSVIGLTTLILCRKFEQPLFSPMWLPVVSLIVAFWWGTAYVLWTWLRGPRLVPALGSETMILLGLVLTSVGLTPALAARAPLARGQVDQHEDTKLSLSWKFRLPQRGAISSTPVVVGDRVYIAAAMDSVFAPYGQLFCLNRDNGEIVWSFSDSQKMKQVHSTPVVVGDCIYIGEGFHQDFDCKVYCLSATSGKKIWEHLCGSHTESTPAVVGEHVYIGAGDDGLYCLEAATGKKVWNFPGFHIDAAPLVVGDRVYVGCGVGDIFKQTMLFCLDAKNGAVLWRFPVEQAVWSRPVLVGGHLYFASGNGRLNESDDRPAGVVFCLNATTGKQLWKRKFPDGVLADVLADGKFLYTGCRDGTMSALYRSDGEVAWSRQLGTPVVTTPAVERFADGHFQGPLYIAGYGGILCCLDCRNGKILWTYDLVEETKVSVELIANPCLTVRRQEGKELRHLYVGLTISGSARLGELHCYAEVSGE